MKKREWERMQIKRELKQHRGTKSKLKKLGIKPTLTTRVFYALNLI